MTHTKLFLDCEISEKTIADNLLGEKIRGNARVKTSKIYETIEGSKMG